MGPSEEKWSLGIVIERMRALVRDQYSERPIRLEIRKLVAVVGGVSLVELWSSGAMAFTQPLIQKQGLKYVIKDGIQLGFSSFLFPICAFNKTKAAEIFKRKMYWLWIVIQITEYVNIRIFYSALPKHAIIYSLKAINPKLHKQIINKW